MGEAADIVRAHKKKLKESEPLRREIERKSVMFAALLAGVDPAGVVRESEAQFLGPFSPRERGSETSFAFESVDDAGRKVVRFSDEPRPRKGERRKAFK